MQALLYFSNDAMIPLVLLVVVIFLIAIFGGSLYVVYRVFRNSLDRENDGRMIRENSHNFSLLGIAFSLAVTFVGLIIKNSHGGIYGNRMFFLALILAVLTAFLGIISLPRWQGFLALINFLFIWIGGFFLYL